MASEAAQSVAGSRELPLEFRAILRRVVNRRVQENGVIIARVEVPEQSDEARQGQARDAMDHHAEGGWPRKTLQRAEDGIAEDKDLESRPDGQGGRRGLTRKAAAESCHPEGQREEIAVEAI